jgi:hypothetical protein
MSRRLHSSGQRCRSADFRLIVGLVGHLAGKRFRAVQIGPSRMSLATRPAKGCASCAALDPASMSFQTTADRTRGPTSRDQVLKPGRCPAPMASLRPTMFHHVFEVVDDAVNRCLGIAGTVGAQKGGSTVDADQAAGVADGGEVFGRVATRGASLIAATSQNPRSLRCDRSIRTPIDCKREPTPSAHSRCHRISCANRSLSHFLTSMTAPVASGWSGCRVGPHPPQTAAFPRRTPQAASRPAKKINSMPSTGS